VSKQKEELILRTLNTSDTALQKEDLSELMDMLTPDDAVIQRRLQTGKARALTHEWNDVSLAASGTWVSGVYADGGIPSDTSHTHTRRNNKVMSIGRVAKATGLMRALDNTLNMGGTVYNDAFALEFAEKVEDAKRVLEYYILNGDKDNTSPQEMDGLLNSTSVTYAVGGALTQTAMRTALKRLYSVGGRATAAYCRPGVAATIATFNDNNINFMINGNASAVTTAGTQTFKYLNPFGGVLDVVTVREDFMPSGSVLLIDESKVRLCYLDQAWTVEDLAQTQDSYSKLIKTYVTLEHRAAGISAIKLTGVTDGIV
jgi:hypothetical protein